MNFGERIDRFDMDNITPEMLADGKNMGSDSKQVQA